MKIKIIFSVFILLLISAVNVFAQIVIPCDPNNPDPDGGDCPLDTWVIVLVFAAAFFAVIKLYRSKKSVL